MIGMRRGYPVADHSYFYENKMAHLEFFACKKNMCLV